MTDATELDEAVARIGQYLDGRPAVSAARAKPLLDALDREARARQAAEGAVAAVREWAQQYVGQWHVASQTPLTFDGGVGAAAHDVLAAIAAATTTDTTTQGGAMATTFTDRRTNDHDCTTDAHCCSDCEIRGDRA